MATCDPADYAVVCEYLYGLKAHGPRFGIDRMEMLAAELGHPERALPLIHVDEPAISMTIGTNTSPLVGKGGKALSEAKSVY
jgi:hypothetical protein